MIIHFNNTELELPVNDNSYRYRAIKGEHSLTLYYSLTQHIEIPLGAYCDFEGERYTLEKPENFKKHNTRNFEYTLIMDSAQAKLSKYKFKDATSRRLKFSLTAKPSEHLQMLVDNLNQRETGWAVGTCIDMVDKVISYNHAFCSDALSQIAEAFETEWEILGKTINLCKVEYNKNNPLPLSYGRGNGFKTGIGRSNDNKKPIEILFVQGGERNIDASKYGSTELLLPQNQTIGYDGQYFSDQEGYDAAKARLYVTDADGFSFRRSDKPLDSQNEDSLDLSHIYPSRVGTINAVNVVDAEKHFYDIIDSSIPANLNFEDCLISGEKMTVIFQDGMLMGKEFEVKYSHNDRRFEIVPQEIDGRTMPDNVFVPVVGGKYAVFNMMLPDTYICDNATKTGASWDMFREAVKFLYENEEQKFTFTGELDGIWAKKDWLNIGGKIKLGGYVLFSDNQFQPDGVIIRIVGIKDYINNPHSPQIELSNEVVGSSISSDLRKIETNEVIVDDFHRDSIQFTKRRFRDSQETIGMLEAALLDKFTNSISPIAIQTMAMLVGDENLQFRFVNNATNPIEVAHNVTYNAETKILTSTAGILQHLTLGINTLSSSHAVSEYKFWTLPEFNTPVLTEAEKKYYLYAKVSKTANTGVFYISETAIAMESVAGYYHLLMGVLNSEYNSERSYVSLYGYTEILPGRMTTDKVISSDGQNFLDFLNNAFRVGNSNIALEFNTQGDGKLRLKGTLVQSQSGDEQPLGCFRGAYNSSYAYYKGDEVTYNGSTYRYINNTQSGQLPTNTAYWAVIAAKGTDGTNGQNGSNGQDGTDGAYFEYRYAKNGSTTSPPAITVTSAIPSGWTTSMPSIGVLEYLWMTVAKKSATGTLLQNWSTPVRTSGVIGDTGAKGDKGNTGDKGDKGDTGAKGDAGPGIVFRGLYNSSETYYGTPQRVDVVKYNDTYYVARVDAGNGFTGIIPTNTSNWNTFGAQFDSVATNLLLAENANIAGWVFRNGRLESQSGNVYMNGNAGTVRLNGTIQLSTGYSGNFSDVNIFYLPKSTANKTITMGYEEEDIGKVCRLFNSNAYGSYDYTVRLYTFGRTADGTTTDTTIEPYVDAVIHPQEVLEVSCFQLPPTLYSSYPNAGKWVITGRFGQDDFRKGTAKGRFPRIMATGRVTGTSSGASISYNFWDGRTSGVFSVSRSGKGMYVVSWTSGVIPSGFFVMLTGYGAIYNGSTPNKCTLYSQSTNSFTIYISGYTDMYDGSCNFIIFAPDWGYPLT
ncbi:MAG: hypothetical protein LBG18_09180 [Mediterranea sp.]|jgi:hypothetical protein|nr:hypothetical protein [Mediterranea sp.]